MKNSYKNIELASFSEGSRPLFFNFFKLKFHYTFLLLTILFVSLGENKAEPKSALEIIYQQDFNSTASDWLQYSVSSDQNWHYSTESDQTQGRNLTVGMVINNYSGDTNSEDWLVSPLLNLSELENPSIAYWILSRFSGSSMEVLYSSDYSGSGDPTAFTWTSLSLESSFLESWTRKSINLSAISQDVYIAFKHTSGTTSNNAASISIDDFSLELGSGDLIDAVTLDKSKTFDIVSWNVEWFGAPEKSRHATSFSEQLIAVSSKIIEFDADVYALQELVTDNLNGNFLQPLVDKLNDLAGSDLYEGVLGPRYSYDWYAPSTDYPAQRLCYIFNKNTVTNTSDFSMFSDLYASTATQLIDGYTGSPSTFWASGRLPYLFDANVTIDGVNQQIKIVNIHGKCCSDSYDRKLSDAKFLINELNTNYAEDNLIILGDYNDYLSGSMSGGESPYASWFVTNEYVDHVMTSSSNIDHITISNELYDEHQSLTNNTREDNVSISDHNPILLRLKFEATATALITDNFSNDVQIYPIPTTNQLTVKLPNNEESLILLMNSNGQLLEKYKVKSEIQISLQTYQSGIYFVKIISGNDIAIKRVSKI